jgi:hypothetical protein
VISKVLLLEGHHRLECYAEVTETERHVSITQQSIQSQLAVEEHCGVLAAPNYSFWLVSKARLKRIDRIGDVESTQCNDDVDQHA